VAEKKLSHRLSSSEFIKGPAARRNAKALLFSGFS